MLKHLLMRPLVLLLLWMSQMSSQMMVMSDLEDTLITLGLKMIVVTTLA